MSPQKKRFVVPAALKVVKLKPQRRFAQLSRLSHEVGWKYRDVVEALEAKRKARSQTHWEKKQAAAVRIYTTFHAKHIY